MALSGPRATLSLSRQSLRQCCGRPSSSASALLSRPAPTSTSSPSSPRTSPAMSSPRRRQFSSLTASDERSRAGSAVEESQQGSEDLPRWTHTPEHMKAPFSINIPKDPARQIWRVNEDPDKLDQVYNRLLGKDGERMLPSELKWLAVTHKSFDQGRRGFNTRLAFFGRQIMALETTRTLLAAPAGPQSDTPDPYGRRPFEHPALANVDKLSVNQPRDILNPARIAKLCNDVGLQSVMRWKPRMPERLQESGIQVVLNTTLFAIVGAISLQHGAEVASRVVRDKILKRMGV